MDDIWRRFGLYADAFFWPRHQWDAPGVIRVPHVGWHARFRLWWGKPHAWLPGRAKLLLEINT